MNWKCFLVASIGLFAMRSIEAAPNPIRSSGFTTNFAGDTINASRSRVTNAAEMAVFNGLFSGLDSGTNKGTFLVVGTPDRAYNTFRLTWQDYKNNTLPRSNNVWRIGPNTDQEGVPANGLSHASHITFEEDFEHLQETYFEWVGTNGAFRRPLSYNVNVNTSGVGYGDVAIFFNGTFFFNDQAGLVTRGLIDNNGLLLKVGFRLQNQFRLQDVNAGNDRLLLQLVNGEPTFYGVENASTYWEALTLTTNSARAFQFKTLSNWFSGDVRIDGRTIINSNLTVNAAQSNNASMAITGNLDVSQFVNAAHGTMAMSTGTVAIGTSASTNLFTNAWSYVFTDAPVGSETNTTLVVSNSCHVFISFGAAMSANASGAGVMSCHVVTNGVPCSVTRIEALAGGATAFETGFKEFAISLPANCRIGLAFGITTAQDVNVKNVVLNVKGAN